MISGYIFSFILAPIMLSQLGLAQFGVWAVTGAFATYAGLIDLGVTRSLERFVAFYDAKGDRTSIERCFGLGLIVVTLVTTVAAAVAYLIAPFIAGVLDDVLTPQQMRVVLMSSVAIFGLNAYRSVLKSVPFGLQRMVPPSLAEILNNTINFTFSVVALVLSQDLAVYALANVAAAVVSLVPTAVVLRHVWSPVRARIPTGELVREVLGFSMKSQLAWIADLVNNQTDKIIIALFIDVRAAGAYEIANRVVVALKAVAIMSISALTAASTAQIASEGRSVIPEFYRRYTERSLSVALPLLLFTCVSVPVLMTAWLGEVPENAALIVVVLTLANAVNLSTGVASTVTMGDGRPGAIANVALVTVALNIVLTLILTPLFGLWGVVAGTALAIVLGSSLFLRNFHRHYGVSAGRYFGAARVPLMAAAAAGVPIVAWLLVGGAAPDERIPAFGMTAAFLAVYVAIYWPLATRAASLPERLRMPGIRSRGTVVAGKA